MKNPERLQNHDRLKVVTLFAGSVYPLTGGNDSSRDYWRVTLDENGKIAKVQDDGDKEHITIVTASGEKKVIDRDEFIGLSRQMMQINGDNIEDEVAYKRMNTLMWNSGLNNTKADGWFARNENGKYLGDLEYTKYSCQNYKEIAQNEQERKDKVELKQMQDSPASLQQDKIVNSMLSTITETWNNDCDVWVYKNFLKGGQDLSLLMGKADGMTANQHFLEGERNNIWSTELKPGLNVMIVDFGTNGKADGHYDHVSSVYYSPGDDKSVIVYNHGYNDKENTDKKPYYYKTLNDFYKSTAWGYRRYYNPWRNK